MIHQTYVTPADRREGHAYLRFGTVDDIYDHSGSHVIALGVELSSDVPLTSMRSTLIMSAAEAIRLSDELRRIASDVTNKVRH